MLDSGCNNIMMPLDAEIQENVIYFDPNGGLTGEGVRHSFTTDASGTLGISLPGQAPNGTRFQFEMIAEGVQLADDLTQTLFPISWFLQAGCDAVFKGRSSMTERGAGHGEIESFELHETSKTSKVTLALNCYNDLWFFKYSIFTLVHDHASAVAALSGSTSKHTATIRAHMVAGHASGRRAHGWKKMEGKGDDIFPDLPCTCTICAESKTEPPSLRKFEGHQPIASLVTGEYIRPGDLYLSNAIDKLQQLDDYARQTEHGHEFTAQAPHAQRHEITLQAPHELRRRSAKPREYWHADTIPLGKTWNHMKQALIMVDDYSRMSFIYLMKDKTQHSVAAALEEDFLRQRPVDTNIPGKDFFIEHTILRSNRGTDCIKEIE